MRPVCWTARAISGLVFAPMVASLGISAAHASELSVTYAVQEKPLKTSAIAGTPLTFRLYSDSACTQQVYQSIVPIENVELISRLKPLTPKGAAKGPTTDELRTTLAGVTAGGSVLYLTVTGTGVTATGEACQIQSGKAGDHFATTTLTVQSFHANILSTTIGTGGFYRGICIRSFEREPVA